MSDLLRVALLGGVLLLSGCAQGGACACPVVGGQVLQSMPASVQFELPATGATTLAITYGGIDGSKLGESDDCGSGAARIVDVGAIDVAYVGSATITLTPLATGSCTLTLRDGTKTDAVPISVVTAATPG